MTKKSAQDVISEVFASRAGQALLQKGRVAREEGIQTDTSSKMEEPFMNPAEPEPPSRLKELETCIVNPYSLVNLVGERKQVC